MRHLEMMLGVTIFLSLTACSPQGANQATNAQTSTRNSLLEPNGALTDVLPDMVPWSFDIVRTIGMDIADDNDRLVSCDDWTYISPESIAGQWIITFELGTANMGRGDVRLRRGPEMPEGWHFYQTWSQQDPDGTCSSFEAEIAIVPPNPMGRWLPLARLSLYTVAEDGGLGDLVVCQMKRFCCLGGVPTCDVKKPCSLPWEEDNLNVGARDVYPFHWQDQFIPIQNVPSGVYWFEHRINPVGVIIESDSSNNSLFFKIEIDQEAAMVRIVQPPEESQCPAQP
jgi:hypothetical protein